MIKLKQAMYHLKVFDDKVLDFIHVHALCQVEFFVLLQVFLFILSLLSNKILVVPKIIYFTITHAFEIEFMRF